MYEGGQIDFATACADIIKGCTLVFIGISEEELDEFADYCKQYDVVVEAGKSHDGRTHIRRAQ